MHKATCLHMRVATTGAKEAVSILQEIKMKSIYITRQTLKSNLKVSDELCRRHKVGGHFFAIWFGFRVSSGYSKLYRKKDLLFALKS